MGTGQPTYPINLADTDKVVSTSAGVADAGKLIKLDAAGRLGTGLAPTTPSDDNDVASKGYVDANGFTPTILVSDTLFISSDGIASNSGTSPAKEKEIELDYAGNYRVKFSIRIPGGAGDAHGQIYKNGVAFGTERVNGATSYVEYSEDLTFAAGDLVQIYLWRAGGSGQVDLANFRIYAFIAPTGTKNLE